MKNKKKKTILIIIIVLFLAAAAVLAVFFISPLCIIKDVDTSKGEGLTKEETDMLTERYTGRNAFMAIGFFGADLKSAEEKIRFEHPEIKSISITYVFPDRIAVVSEERFPSFLASYHGMYVSVDPEGTVISTYEEGAEPGIPKVAGVDIVNVKSGAYAFEKGSRSADCAIKLCGILKAYGIYEKGLDIVDVEDPDSVWMYFYPGLSVKFGKADKIDEKVSKLLAVLEAGYSGESKGVIDFTSGTNPVFRSSEE